jgi:aldehyde dehydrogenase (NAD+)
MREYLKFYIDGQWVDPVELRTLDVDNPTLEQVGGKIAIGSEADVDKAVNAARKAFNTWSQSTREERLDVLQAILDQYQARAKDLADAVHEEMGAPPSLAAGPQVMMGLGHLATAIDVLKNYSFEEQRGESMVVKEPIGVCGLITPWNWPINQIACKVFPALAAGCTMVLKPSEVAPFSGQIFTEIIDAAGLPAGVYNMVFGDGPAPHCPAIPASTWSRSPGRRAPGSRWRAMPHRRSSGWPRSSAARARTSCSMTRPSHRA